MSDIRVVCLNVSGYSSDAALKPAGVDAAEDVAAFSFTVAVKTSSTVYQYVFE